MYVERCEHCECKLIPHGRRASGRSSKIVHYGSLTACGIIQATKGAIRLRIAERDEARQRAADFERDIACLEERAKALAARAEAGYALSTWAASIKWSDRDTNTKAWLDGLRERIETVQRLAGEKP